MIPIVILAGQSNMLGHGELSDIDDPLLPPEVKLASTSIRATAVSVPKSALLEAFP